MSGGPGDVFDPLDLFFGLAATSVPRPSARKSGRPLAAQTIAIREAISALTDEFKVMTVRQIFYALAVAAVVEKSEAGYRQVQRQALLMRREEQLPWEFIADGTRWMRKPRSWDSVADALRATQRAYRRNLWRSQRIRIEVWLEKDALASIVAEATERWDVALMVSRGTSSATFLHSAAQEARDAWEQAEIETVVYALYDRDAAGARAARTVEKGFRDHAPLAPIHFELLAVTDRQVREWNLPTRPAKPTDPEAHKFGDTAVELDAIPPDRLVQLVEAAILTNIDADAWAKEQAFEVSEQATLRRMVDEGVGR